MKKYYFIAGLPRSGSTLFSNILCQNPRFHGTGTSGIMDVMFGVRNHWDKVEPFKKNPNKSAQKRVLKGILEDYYSDIAKPVIFDKCRGWLSLIEMAEYVLDEKVKILVPVRDLRDVLANWEKLLRKNDPNLDPQRVGERVMRALGGDQPIGLAVNRVRDAVQRGYRDRLFFVEFEKLTAHPEETMRAVYNFIGEEYYPHDFNNVEQVNNEDDAIFGFANLHTIKPKVEPRKSDWREIIGDQFEGIRL